MKNLVARREFLKTAGAVAALAALGPQSFAAEEKPLAAGHFKKGIMWGTVGGKGSVADKMKAIKAAGFDGAEMMGRMDQAAVLKARDEAGLEIPSVCCERHWKLPLSNPDPKVRAEGLADLQQTLRDAKAYGAGSVLLVPGIVNQEVSFEDCWKRSIEQIRLAIPLAGELGVKISIENVWNNFITTEDQAVRYLDEINSPWVGWHFDCGNIIRYGDPIVWINALGKHINRVHIKEYSRDRAMRSGDVWKGFNVPLLEGANNWPGITKALAAAGYSGYLITEQGGGDTPEGLHDLSERLGKIIAG
ncbi:MAG: sugar phosphate isomerase/epimerase family protein [Verrucomicrobiota bacterium]|nr:sugar phosphate isomerase/epimerase [Verrucomicrobiota bacterium]MCC6820554.1 sugar phosphate isomerase/epimerase [Limisphaerales bacterium]